MRSTELHRDVFKSGSKTYFNSSLFFPPDVRDDVFILYGFVRVADNFVDAVPQQPDEFRRFVGRYRSALAGTPADDVIIDSFVDLSERRGFRAEWTDGFLRAMELDLEKRVHATLDETLEYVYGSAEVIGLYMARIMRLDPVADDAARMLGRSMQFINFIRDIAEDNELGRTYLPISESSLPDLNERTTREQPDEFRRFLGVQLDRYREWQAAAEAGYRFLPRRYLVPIKTAAEMYNWTASVIEADPFVVYRRKVKPGRGRILGRVLGNFVRPGPNAGAVPR
ncbi:MAG: phytoene/squalene synthase family protein [Spirochaetota bacterium]